MARILVVDSAAFMRAHCSKLLCDKGYEVVEAATHTEALRAYQEHWPDGVLLDLTMPKMNGIMTLQEILRMNPSARVAMVTAMGQKSVVINALQAGAMDFLTKPLDGQLMLAAIQKLLD